MPMIDCIFNEYSNLKHLIDVGGLGIATGENKLDYETKILHDEEVNRARYMP